MKTPLAWLQVSREKMRLAVALAGIAFADILMFMQMGFKDSLYEAAVRPHYTLNADLVLVNSQFETFFRSVISSQGISGGGIGQLFIFWDGGMAESRNSDESSHSHLWN
jgi:hypothetical protein